MPTSTLGLNCVVLLAVMARAAIAQPHSWNNVEVLPKTPEVALVIGSTKVPFIAFPGLAIEVAADRIRVQSGNLDGEMPKRDVLFASAAAPYYDDFLRRDPDNLWALQCRAIAHYCAGRVDAAQGDIDELIRRKPSDAAAYAHRAKIWPAHDDDTLRFKDYDTAIRLNPDFAPAYWERGLLRESYGNSSKAAADYGHVIRLDPKNVQALRLRVYCWCDLKEFDKALDDCNVLIKIDPQDATYWCLRGNANSGKQAIDESISDYTEAIRLCPSYSLAFLYRSCQLASKQEYEKSIDDVREALRIYPRDAEACLWAAWILATCPIDELRDGKEAMTFATKAGALRRWTEADLPITMAAVHAELGNFGEAIRCQKAAIEKALPADKPEYLANLKCYQEGRRLRLSLTSSLPTRPKTAPKTAP